MHSDYDFYLIIWYCRTGVLCTSMIDHQQLNLLLSSLRKRIKAADFALASAMSVESIDAWFGGIPPRHHMGGESVHLGHFHSDKVMVVFLITECASQTHSKFKSTMARNCYDWLKKYTVIEVVARENGGCARKKGLF